MRSALLVALFVSACQVEPGPAAVECTSKFDCATGEICAGGMCQAQAMEMRMPPMKETPDAGLPVQPDSGVIPVSDAGIPDVQTAPTDAGVSADSGCATNITIVGQTGSYCTIGQAITAAPAG